MVGNYIFSLRGFLGDEENHGENLMKLTRQGKAWTNYIIGSTDFSIFPLHQGKLHRQTGKKIEARNKQQQCNIFIFTHFVKNRYT